MKPTCSLSQIKWHSNFMCLINSWNIGLEAMWITSLLSQYKEVARVGWTYKSSSKEEIITKLLIVVAIAWYFASPKNHDIVTYILNYHDTRVLPIKM